MSPGEFISDQDVMSATLTWSLGTNRFDNKPRPRAGTLHEFAAEVLAHRADDKASAGYICAPFRGDGRRCLINASPRSWLALDVDGIDADALIDWRLHLTRWRGFGWPTASSTPQAPRERVIVELSEPVDRAQGIGIGALILRDVAENFGAGVRIDPCGFRAEQPAFLPLVGAKPFYLLGEALDVPLWLEQAPVAPPPPPPATGIVVALADTKMRYIVETLGDCGLLLAPMTNGRGYSVVCPWSRLHTNETSPTATVVLYPSEENGWYGGFKCLHSHCADRTLRDLTDLLALAVKRGMLCQA